MTPLEIWRKSRPGIQFTLLASALYATAGAFAAVITPKIGTSNLTGVRYLVQALISLPYLLKNPEILAETPKKEVALILVSGIGIGVATLGTFASLLLIPIVDTTVLLNAQPIVVLIISSIWLKERIRYLEIFVVILVILGVVGVCQPVFIFGAYNQNVNGLSMSWLGYVLAIAACFGSAITLCILRRVRSSSVSYILFMQSLVVMACSLSLGLIIHDTKDPMSWRDWAFLLGTTFTDLMSRVFTTLSVKYEESNLLVIVQTTEILFSLLYQLIWFKIYPTLVGTIGVVLIVFGIIIISVKDNIYAAIDRLMNSNQNESTTLI